MYIGQNLTALVQERIAAQQQAITLRQSTTLIRTYFFLAFVSVVPFFLCVRVIGVNLCGFWYGVGFYGCMGACLGVGHFMFAGLCVQCICILGDLISSVLISLFEELCVMSVLQLLENNTFY
jgi:hypothetical protein